MAGPPEPVSDMHSNCAVPPGTRARGAIAHASGARTGKGLLRKRVFPRLRRQPCRASSRIAPAATRPSGGLLRRNDGSEL